MSKNFCARQTVCEWEQRLTLRQLTQVVSGLKPGSFLGGCQAGMSTWTWSSVSQRLQMWLNVEGTLKTQPWPISICCPGSFTSPQDVLRVRGRLCQSRSRCRKAAWAYHEKSSENEKLGGASAAACCSASTWKICISICKHQREEFSACLRRIGFQLLSGGTEAANAVITGKTKTRQMANTTLKVAKSDKAAQTELNGFYQTSHHHKG